METLTLEKPKAGVTDNSLFILVLIPDKNILNHDICGLSIQDWMDSTLSSYDHKKLEVSMRDDILSIVNGNATQHKYTMVVYSDMPLLTSKTIDDAVGFVSSLDHKAARMPRGWLFETEFIKTSTKIDTVTIQNLDPEDFLAVFSLQQLEAATAIMRGRINSGHMSNGVKFLDTKTAYIDARAQIGDGTVIHPGVVIRDATKIGSNCRIGNFVEIKKSTIGNGTKISHMTYVGDASIGENCNVGCGVVFCNYDGRKKHKTVVKDNVFIGSNVNLVAPVTIGENVTIAAGSTITHDVEEGSLAIARERQTTKSNYQKAKKIESTSEVLTSKTRGVESQSNDDVCDISTKPSPEPIIEVEIIAEPEPTIEVEIIETPETEPVVKLEADEAPEPIVEIEVTEEQSSVPEQPEPTPEPEIIELEITDDPKIEVTEEPIPEPKSKPSKNDIVYDAGEYESITDEVTVKYDWDNDDREPFYQGRN